MVKENKLTCTKLAKYLKDESHANHGYKEDSKINKVFDEIANDEHDHFNEIMEIAEDMGCTNKEGFNKKIEPLKSLIIPYNIKYNVAWETFNESGSLKSSGSEIMTLDANTRSKAQKMADKVLEKRFGSNKDSNYPRGHYRFTTFDQI